MEQQGIDASKVDATIATLQEPRREVPRGAQALRPWAAGRAPGVDAAVKGIDRAPTQGIDDIVEAIQKHAGDSRAAA